MFIPMDECVQFLSGGSFMFLFMCHPKLSLRNGKECSCFLKKKSLVRMNVVGGGLLPETRKYVDVAQVVASV